MAKNDKAAKAVEEEVVTPEADEEEIPEAPEIDVDEDEAEDEEEVEVKLPAIPVPVADDPTADAVAEAHRSQLRVIRTRLQSEIEAIDAQLA